MNDINEEEKIAEHQSRNINQPKDFSDFDFFNSFTDEQQQNNHDQSCLKIRMDQKYMMVPKLDLSHDVLRAQSSAHETNSNASYSNARRFELNFQMLNKNDGSETNSINSIISKQLDESIKRFKKNKVHGLRLTTKK